MLRLSHGRRVARLTIVVLALAGVVALGGCTSPEPAPRVPLAPLDRAVPAKLSTATFGLG